MALKITDECISCGACEPECPTEAIFEGDEIYEIDSDKCVECEGYFDTSQCIEVCPVDCIIPAQQKTSNYIVIMYQKPPILGAYPFPNTLAIKNLTTHI